MKLKTAFLIAVLAVSTHAAAQLKMDSDSITSIDIKKSKEISFDLENQEIEYIKDGTVIIRSSTPNSDLTLITDYLTFDYEGAEGPASGGHQIERQRDHRFGGTQNHFGRV